MLGLVGDDQPPADLREPRRVAQHHAVGSQDDLIDGQVQQMPSAPVVPTNWDIPSEPAYLVLPGAQQRRRAHHKRGTRLGVPAVQVQRDHLDRLAQPHIVGQAAAEPGVAHPGQPGQAPLLIRPERRREP
jgi:hypothetical protein